MEKRKVVIIIVTLTLIFTLGLYIYTNYYLKWIKIALIYSDPYSKEEIDAISSIAEKNINNYCDSLNSKYRFKIDVIYLPFTDKQNETLNNIKNNYSFIVGPDYTYQLGYISSVNNTIFISPNSSSDFFSRDNQPIFRLRCLDSNQGKIIAKFLVYNNITNAITLQSELGWSGKIMERFDTEYQKLGGKIIINKNYNSTLNNFSDFLLSLETDPVLKLEKINKTAVVQIGVFETYELIKDIKDDSVLRKLVWVGSDAIPSKLIEGATGNNSNVFNNINFYAPLISPSYSNEYFKIDKEYNSLIGEELDFEQSARYDSLWIFAKAIIASDSVDVRLVKEQIPSVSIGYLGISGNCSINNEGDRIEGNYNIYKMGNNINGTDKLLCYIYDPKQDAFKIP
jgi:ABC-type branched-subunit amino acid transport system substrate-binding protein